MSARLIGGEMLVWSDLDGKHGPAPVRAAALRPLLAAVSGRTLVAGPHDLSLIDEVPSEQMTLLVRGLPDADLLADRYGDRPGVTVLCGSLEKLAAAPAYDTVIALDGLGRLRSAEDDALSTSWAEDMAMLVAVLRPGGRLLLGTENLFGLHRMLSLTPEPADTDWAGTGEFDAERPSSPSQMVTALESAGLTVAGTFAGFPSATAPSVLLSDHILEDLAVRGYVSAVVRSSFDGGAPALADPRRLASGALRASVAGGLAPAWFAVAQRGETGIVPVPAGLIASADGHVDQLHRDARGWVRGDTPLPVGRGLDERLLAASLRRDLPALRELLTAWQSGPSAGVPADQLVDGTALVPSGDPIDALSRLAATMIDEGHAYLWPAPADRAELTALLAAMAGRELDPATLRESSPVPHDVRELTQERERLTRELAESRAKQDWYEKMLQNREAELKRVRRINTVLMATMPGKAAKAGYGGLRAGKKAAREAIRKLRG